MSILTEFNKAAAPWARAFEVIEKTTNAGLNHEITLRFETAGGLRHGIILEGPVQYPADPATKPGEPMSDRRLRVLLNELIHGARGWTEARERPIANA